MCALDPGWTVWPSIETNVMSDHTVPEQPDLQTISMKTYVTLTADPWTSSSSTALKPFRNGFELKCLQNTTPTAHKYITFDHSVQRQHTVFNIIHTQVNKKYHNL